MISGAAALTHQKQICPGPTQLGPSKLLRARQGRCARMPFGEEEQLRIPIEAVKAIPLTPEEKAAEQAAVEHQALTWQIKVWSGVAVVALGLGYLAYRIGSHR